jgi:hypothetical protein
VVSNRRIRSLLRRVADRVRGDLRTETLIARGLRVGHDTYINPSTRFDGRFLFLISIGRPRVDRCPGGHPSGCDDR